jgi:hypothetical protein
MYSSNLSLQPQVNYSSNTINSISTTLIPETRVTSEQLAKYMAKYNQFKVIVLSFNKVLAGNMPSLVQLANQQQNPTISFHAEQQLLELINQQLTLLSPQHLTNTNTTKIAAFSKELTTQIQKFYLQVMSLANGAPRHTNPGNAYSITWELTFLYTVKPASPLAKLLNSKLIKHWHTPSTINLEQYRMIHEAVRLIVAEMISRLRECNQIPLKLNPTNQNTSFKSPLHYLAANYFPNICQQIDELNLIQRTTSNSTELAEAIAKLRNIITSLARKTPDIQSYDHNLLVDPAQYQLYKLLLSLANPNFSQNDASEANSSKKIKPSNNTTSPSNQLALENSENTAIAQSTPVKQNDQLNQLLLEYEEKIKPLVVKLTNFLANNNYQQDSLSEFVKTILGYIAKKSENSALTNPPSLAEATKSVFCGFNDLASSAIFDLKFSYSALLTYLAIHTPCEEGKHEATAWDTITNYDLLTTNQLSETVFLQVIASHGQLIDKQAITIIKFYVNNFLRDNALAISFSCQQALFDLGVIKHLRPCWTSVTQRHEQYLKTVEFILASYQKFFSNSKISYHTLTTVNKMLAKYYVAAPLLTIKELEAIREQLNSDKLTKSNN